MISIIEMMRRRWCAWGINHWPVEKVRSAGINLESRCRICGKEILMDSQGNWF